MIQHLLHPPDARPLPAQLRGSDFDALVHSPLARAAETARIVWGDRDRTVTELATLREVDLYAMQVCPCACHPNDCSGKPRLLSSQGTTRGLPAADNT